MTLFPNRRGLVIQKYLWPSTDDDEIISAIIRVLSTKKRVLTIVLYRSAGTILFKNIPILIYPFHYKPHIRITLALESIELKLKLSMYPFVK